MDDVLTKEERDWLADLLPAGGHASKIIDRLVSEVERLRVGERLYEGVVRLNEQLRERNEKLVAVAKAVDDALRNWRKP